MQVLNRKPGSVLGSGSLGVDECCSKPGKPQRATICQLVLPVPPACLRFKGSFGFHSVRLPPTRSRSALAIWRAARCHKPIVDGSLGKFQGKLKETSGLRISTLGLPKCLCQLPLFFCADCRTEDGGYTPKTSDFSRLVNQSCVSRSGSRLFMASLPLAFS